MNFFKISIAFMLLLVMSHNISAMFASKEQKEKARKSLELHEEEQKKLLETQKKKLVDERTPYFETILKTFAALAGVKPKAHSTSLSFYSKLFAQASCYKGGVFCLRIENGKVYGRVTLGSSTGSSTNCFDFTEKRMKEAKNLKKQCTKLLQSINAVTFSALCNEDKLIECLVHGTQDMKSYSVVFKRDSIDNPQYSQYGSKNIGKTTVLDEDGKKIRNKYRNSTIFSVKDHSCMPQVGEVCSSEYIGVEFD